MYTMHVYTVCIIKVEYSALKRTTTVDVSKVIKRCPDQNRNEKL